MADDLTQRIASDPRYLELKTRRTRCGWWLTIAMLVVYYGFILLVAFNKPFLATRLTTVGMPLGLGVIVFTILITGLYVWRANRDYDTLTDQITKGALK